MTSRGRPAWRQRSASGSTCAGHRGEAGRRRQQADRVGGAHRGHGGREQCPVGVAVRGDQVAGRGHQGPRPIQVHPGQGPPGLRRHHRRLVVESDGGRAEGVEPGEGAQHAPVALLDPAVRGGAVPPCLHDPGADGDFAVVGDCGQESRPRGEDVAGGVGVSERGAGDRPLGARRAQPRPVHELPVGDRHRAARHLVGGGR